MTRFRGFEPFSLSPGADRSGSLRTENGGEEGADEQNTRRHTNPLESRST